jgi:eukaryotic-like serine/threonine-protein kinase
LVVRPELEAVVQKALAKKPKDRFADANEMQRALRAVPAPAATLEE